MVSVLQILLSIFSLLSAVTLGLLAKRTQSQSDHLRKIVSIVKGWWMIFMVVAVASLLGKWGVWALFFGITLYGVTEYIGISKLCPANKLTIKIFYSSAILIFYFVLFNGHTLLALMFSLVFQLFISTIFLLQNKQAEAIPRSIGAGFGIFTLVVALSSVAQLSSIGEQIWKTPDSGVVAVLILIMLTSLNDVFQFIGGNLFGKRRIVPHLSPNKTEAGFIGGILGTGVLGTILLHFILQVPLGEAFFLGLMIGISGIFGDLFLSAIKRSNNVKDFSDLIPGHGGLLDRIDSLIFTAPTFLFTLSAFYEVTL